MTSLKGDFCIRKSTVFFRMTGNSIWYQSCDISKAFLSGKAFPDIRQRSATFSVDMKLSGNISFPGKLIQDPCNTRKESNFWLWWTLGKRCCLERESTCKKKKYHTEELPRKVPGLKRKDWGKSEFVCFIWKRSFGSFPYPGLRLGKKWNSDGPGKPRAVYGYLFSETNNSLSFRKMVKGYSYWFYSYWHYWFHFL